MRFRSPLLVVFLIVFIDLIGFGIVIPMLPLFAVRFGASEVEVGLLAASYSAMQFVFAPLWGRLSDRVGRRPILLGSLAGGVAAMALAAFADSLAVLFAARLLAGIAAANIGTAQAVIADITTPEDRGKGMGLIGAAFGLGFILGPALGGLLGSSGAVEALRSALSPLVGAEGAAALIRHPFAPPFLFAALLGLANTLLAARILPETRPASPDGRRTVGRRRLPLRAALAAPGVGPVLLLHFAVVLAFACFEVSFSLFLKDRFAWDQRQIGYVFAWIGVVVVLVQGGAIGRLTRLFGETALLPVGLALAGAGLASLPHVPGLATLLACTAVIALGNGLNTPSLNSLVSRLSREDQQGGILGVHQSLASLARVLGPPIGGLLYARWGRAAPFTAAGWAMLACAGAALALRAGLQRRVDARIQAPTPAATEAGRGGLAREL